MILKGFLHVFGKIEKVLVKCQKHKTRLCFPNKVFVALNKKP